MRFALVVVLLLFSRPLFAAPSPVGEPGARRVTHDLSRTRYAEGMRLYDKRRYEEARAAFLQAHALEKRPAVTLMLGLSAKQTGHLLEALSWFDTYLSEVAEPSEKARTLIDAARKDIRARLGVIKIVAPADAEVALDGERLTSFASPIDVEPGVHTVTIVRQPDRISKTGEVHAGTSLEVKLPIAEEPGPPPPPKPKPPTPIAPRELESPSLLAPPQTTWPVYVAGGIGLVGLAGAAVFGGLSLDAAHAMDVARAALERDGASLDTCKRPTLGTKHDDVCSIVRRHESTQDGHAQAFHIALGVGITGVAIAAGWYLLAPKEGGSREGAPKLAPMIGTSTAGASLSGTF